MDSSQISSFFKWRSWVHILCLSHTVITEHIQSEGPVFRPFLSCLPHFFPSLGGFTKLKHSALHQFSFLLGSIIRQVLSSQINSYNIISNPCQREFSDSSKWSLSICCVVSPLSSVLQHLPNFSYLNTTVMVFPNLHTIYVVIYLIFIFTLFSKF